MLDSLLTRHKPDILDCIANLSNDEVFTPPAVANKMLDLLPPEVWTNPDLRFLDPGCKSGVFLREAAKRLMTGLAAAIPDEAARREHIFKHMLHGIAITELTAQMSRRTLYYSKDASSEHSVVRMPTAEGNIRYRNISHTFKNGVCVHCGAPESAARDLTTLESHAYLFIHETIDPSMKFDVIIGNPPYQLHTVRKVGDAKSTSNQAKPLYHLFVQAAKAMRPQYISMIIPSRWFAGGMGLDAFREEMLNDEQLSHLVDYTNAKDCFPGIDLSGGVSYFLWERGRTGSCEFTSIHAGAETRAHRKLNTHPVLVRSNQALSIIEKVTSKGFHPFTDFVMPLDPFGVKSNERGEPSAFSGSLALHTSQGVSFIDRKRISKNLQLVDSWKILISKTTAEHAGEADVTGKSRVLSRLRVLAPGEVCSFSYMIVTGPRSEVEANQLLAYLKTKFVRFLILQATTSINLSKDKFAFVPSISLEGEDAKTKDPELYAAYGLTDAEIAYIESTIKEMA